MENTGKSKQKWADVKGIDLVESITIQKGTEPPVTFSNRELKWLNEEKKGIDLIKSITVNPNTGFSDTLYTEWTRMWYQLLNKKNDEHPKKK